MALFIAGMDTTAHLVGMTLFAISENPEIQEKARQEIDGLFENYQELTHEDLKNLNYVNILFKETLRMYNPAFGLIPRKVNKTHSMDGIPVQKNDVVLPFFLSPTNPKYFENPDNFNPDRWLKNQDFNQYAYVPFSSGGRNCIG